MIELANKIVEIVQSGNILWLAVIAIIALTMKLSRILEFFEGRKKTQITRLVEASKCELLDANFKEFISHEIQREYFLYVAKITAEKQYRDKLFEVHKNANGNLSFVHFKRASSHLKYKDCQLSVSISKFDIVSGFVSIGLALFLGFIGLALFMIPAFIKPITIIQAITFYGFGAFFLGIATFFSFQTFPLYSAKLIKAELDKLKNEALEGK